MKLLLDTNIFLEVLLEQSQYALAVKYDLTIVSFDTDFDRTTRGRSQPATIA